LPDSMLRPCLKLAIAWCNDAGIIRDHGAGSISRRAA